MESTGIHFQGEELRLARLRLKKNSITPLSLQTIDVKQLYNQTVGRRIVSGIEGRELFFRWINLEEKQGRHFKERVLLSIEMESPLPPEEIFSVPLLSNLDSQKILIAHCHKKSLSSHLDSLRKRKITPDQVTALPFALLRYLQWKLPRLEEVLAIDLGNLEWNGILIEKGFLKSPLVIEGGTESLYNALAEDRVATRLPEEIRDLAKQISLSNPSKDLLLKERFEKMAKELAKQLFSLRSNKPPIPICFTGNTSAFFHFKEALLQELKEFVSHEIPIDAPEEEKDFALAIGLALTPPEKDLQLAREEFSPEKKGKRAGILAIGSWTLSLLLSGVLVWGGEKALEEKKRGMIDWLERSLKVLEPSLCKKLFAQGEEAALEGWIREVARQTEKSPYLLEAPKVSEVLSWIEHHPLVQGNTSAERIDLLSVRYFLLKYPKLDHPKDPYVAKIELHFRSESPLHARKFHEALLEGDPMIDPSQPILWDRKEDFYQATLFLKGSHV